MCIQGADCTAVQRQGRHHGRSTAPTPGVLPPDTHPLTVLSAARSSRRYHLQKSVAFNVNVADPTYLFDLAKCPADPSVFAVCGSTLLRMLFWPLCDPPPSPSRWHFGDARVLVRPRELTQPCPTLLPHVAICTCIGWLVTGLSVQSSAQGVRHKHPSAYAGAAGRPQCKGQWSHVCERFPAHALELQPRPCVGDVGFAVRAGRIGVPDGRGYAELSRHQL
jgi:hypothetical protein